MKVRCIQTIPTEEQRRILGSTYPMVDDRVAAGSSLHIGCEYHIYGMVMTDGIHLVLVDLGAMRWSYEPLILFEMRDPSVSRYWHLHITTDGDTELYPAEFFDYPYLLNDVSEENEQAIAVFQRMQARMRHEFKERNDAFPA